MQRANVDCCVSLEARITRALHLREMVSSSWTPEIAGIMIVCRQCIVLCIIVLDRAHQQRALSPIKKAKLSRSAVDCERKCHGLALQYLVDFSQLATVLVIHPHRKQTPTGTHPFSETMLAKASIALRTVATSAAVRQLSTSGAATAAGVGAGRKLQKTFLDYLNDANNRKKQRGHNHLPTATDKHTMIDPLAVQPHHDLGDKHYLDYLDEAPRHPAPATATSHTVTDRLAVQPKHNIADKHYLDYLEEAGGKVPASATSAASHTVTDRLAVQPKHNITDKHYLDYLDEANLKVASSKCAVGTGKRTKTAIDYLEEAYAKVAAKTKGE